MVPEHVLHSGRPPAISPGRWVGLVLFSGLVAAIVSFASVAVVMQPALQQFHGEAEYWRD